MRIKFVVPICCLVLAIVVGQTWAQSDPLTEEQKATMVFDVRLAKMLDGGALEKLGVRNDLKGVANPDDPTSMDPNKVERIFGAVNLPNSIAEFNELQTDPSKIDLFVRIQFADAESMAPLKAEMEKSETQEINGKTYFVMPDIPNNAFIGYAVNDTTIEMGTTRFITQKKSLKPFTQGLDAAWKKVPNHGFRLAFDMKGESSLLAEAVQMGKAQAQQGNPMMAATVNGMLDLVPKMNAMRMSFDPDDSDLFLMSFDAVDSAAADEIAGGLNFLLQTGAQMGKAQLGGIPMLDDNSKSVLNSILGSLNAKTNSNQVDVRIPRPDGFDEFLQTAKAMAPAMMMSMGGPPPGGQAFDATGELEAMGEQQGGDPFADEAGAANPAGENLGGEQQGGDPFADESAGEGSDTKQGGGDPFGDEEPAEGGGGDPFGDEEPAEGGGDPFGGGGDADPFSDVGDENPFG